MPELLQNASDDQYALILCAGALLVSGTAMYFSYYIGLLTRNQKHTGVQRKPHFLGARKARREALVSDRQDKAA